MPPSVALALWFLLLAGLLCFDPGKIRPVSAASWVPILWMFIAGSRLPSQWLGAIRGVVTTANLEDGNPLDRTIDLILIGFGVAILLSRSFRWSQFLKRNFALVAFVAFALLSILWSDFPFVAFKKWFRDLGNYIMVLIVLSDPYPLNAIRTVLRRTSYLLIPLSIVLDKYFPNASKMYDSWTGIGVFVGVTTGKNLLGLVALLSGIFFFWEIATRWRSRKGRTDRAMLVDLAFLAMSLWVLNTAESTTCKVCMAIGCFVILAMQSKWGRRHPRLLKTLIPIMFSFYLLLTLGFGLMGDMAAVVGKDPTLTDRTKIWAFLLGMHSNWLIGTGYESFWVGPRLQWFWQNAGLGHINEAHNGYLEVYLNLGVIGLILMSAVIIAFYRTICTRMTAESNLGSLSMAIWAIMLFYCVTEAGFRSGLMWLVFLLVGVSVPERVRRQVREVAIVNNANAVDRIAPHPAPAIYRS